MNTIGLSTVPLAMILEPGSIINAPFVAFSPLITVPAGIVKTEGLFTSDVYT